jgi:hypothetical protein
LNIPSSKTDQLANTTKLVINSCNNRVICPVKNMINYLNARPKVPLLCFLSIPHNIFVITNDLVVSWIAITFILKLKPDIYDFAVDAL